MNAFWLVLAVGLAGCSKTLTESSAVGTTQKFVDSQGGGIVYTFVGDLTSQLGVEQHLPPEMMPNGVRRLIKEGFIQAKTVPVTFPNIAGEFTGSHIESIGLSQMLLTDTLSMQTGTENPPSVRGTFRTCCCSDMSMGCLNGSLQGVVRRGGPTVLTMIPGTIPPPNSGGYTFSGWWIGPRVLTISLINGDPDLLSGGWGGTIPAMNSSVPFQARGHAGPPIQRDAYVYAWSDKLPKDSVNAANLKLGHLVVDSCDHLLLSSETTASASCKTHVKVTGPAEIIFGAKPTEQSMQTSFGKQPDGGWVGTSVAYSAPQYSVLQ